MKLRAKPMLFLASCVCAAAGAPLMLQADAPITLAAPADAYLSWTVDPGTLLNGVWTIPGTTTLTASIVDGSGEPITEGTLYWQVCTDQRTLQGLPSSECATQGPKKWQSAVVIDPAMADVSPISPCLCEGQQLGFRLLYRSRGSGYRSVTGDSFDLLASMDCPTRTNCP